MKRILILLLALLPVMAHAQNYKPLESVEIPESPANSIYVSEQTNALGVMYYTSSHHFVSRGITLTIEYPYPLDMFLNIEGPSIPEGATAKTSIGGNNYYLKTILISGQRVYIDLMSDHVKHISVSGIQSITFLNNGDIIHQIEFNPVEQELWRRTAEELIIAQDKFKIIK